jgi:prepilin-type processing-associated H-X9-DG protein
VWSWREIAAALTSLLVAVPLPAAARGEPSYHLPEVVVAVPTRAAQSRPPVWSKPIDAPTDERALLAFGTSGIVFVSNGRVCGYAEADGVTRWCAGRGSNPIYTSGLIVYVTTDGTIRAVKSSDGSARWRFPAPSGADQGSRYPSPPITVGIWPAGHDVLFARSGGGGALEYGDLSSAGTPFWVAKASGMPVGPVVRGSQGIWGIVDSGAALPTLQHLVTIGRGGGLSGVVSTMRQIVEVAFPRATLAGNPYDADDLVLTFNIEVIDMRTGVLASSYDFAPDYDANAESYRSGTLYRDVGLVEPSLVGRVPNLRIERNWVYGAVGQKLYRYQLTTRTQRPLLISGDGDFLGGPLRGAVYVARKGGVWSLRPGTRTVEARLVAPSESQVTAFAIDNGSAYIGFADGHVVGVDVRDGHATFDAQTCVARRFATTAGFLYVLCSGKPGWVIEAYANGT